jgi:hypothetical protein
LIAQGLDLNIQDYSIGGLRTTNSLLDQMFAVLDAGQPIDEPTKAALALIRRTEVCTECETSLPLAELHESTWPGQAHPWDGENGQLLPDQTVWRCVDRAACLRRRHNS